MAEYRSTTDINWGSLGVIPAGSKFLLDAHGPGHMVTGRVQWVSGGKDYDAPVTLTYAEFKVLYQAALERVMQPGLVCGPNQLVFEL